MAYPMDTPSRVLRRVQQMEDVELPSLPSIEHGLDDYTASEAESSLEASQRSRKGLDESDMATPHPLRQSYKPRSSGNSFANTTHTDPSSIGSPFPPDAGGSDSSMDHPSVPVTSTPTTLQSRVSRSNLTGAAMDRGQDMERTKSSHSLKSSTGTGRENWHTPGEMSASFSGDEISPEGSFEGPPALGEKMVPLNDTSMGRDKSFNRPLTETPYTRRLSNGNVLHQRPGKRVSSNIYRTEPGNNLGSLSPISASTGTSSTPHSNQTALHLPTAARIPSLTHSEQSETDGSEPAGTPEPPSREISMRSTPRPHDVSQRYDDSHGERSRSITEVVEFELPSLPSLAVNAANEIDLTSPVKGLVSEIMSTPGVGRLQSPRHMSPYADQQTPYAPSPLSDVTISRNNSPSSIPFTPSPGSIVSKGSDFSTPRAPLNDAERRKNHVLAVLSSTEMPSRKTAVRRTPHPLRRVSNAHDSVTSSGSPALQLGSTFRSASENIQTDHSRPQTANDSFVSVASSADLTSDHRASRIRAGMGRANTSFPTILLPTGKNTSSGSLKGISETRADGVKIHRHLNAMNKQLLQTNAGLAREAEAWRDEVDRLMEVLRQAGVEYEEVDVLANLSMQMDQTDVSQLDAIPERLRHRSRDTSGVYSPLAKPAEEPSIQGEVEDIPLMSELLAERLTLVDEKRNNGDEFPAGALLDDLSDGDHQLVMEEVVDRLDLLEDHLVQKAQLVKDLRQELDVAQGFGSTEANSTAGTQLRLDDLTHKLEEADKERASMQTSFAQRTEEHAKKFGEICTGFEEQVAAMEKELADAKLEVDRLRTEKERLESLQSKDSQGEREVELRKQLGEVEVELRVAREESSARATEVEGLKQIIQASQDEKVELLRRVELAEVQLGEAEDHLQSVEQELQDARTQLEERETLAPTNDTDAEKSHGLESINAQLEDELVEQDKDIQELSDKVAELQADLDAMLDEREGMDALRAEIERLNHLVVEVEDELAERDEEVEAWRGKVNLSQSISNSQPGHKQDDIAAQLEQELEDAFKEIGRLKHELSSTPHRKSVIDMRDMRIQSLEREKAVLQERLANARDTTLGLKVAASPFKATPLLRKMPSMKHLTPGPIMETSWLQTTMGDANEAALRGQMEYLQQELDAANNQLDANFTRLEAAGLNGLNLAEKLANAQDRVAELEAELRALRVKGKGTDATRTTEQAERAAVESRLKAAVKSVNDQLKTVKADYAAEQDRLQGDNARLRDFVTEVRAKSDAKFDQVLGDMERMQVDTSATVKRLTSEKAKAEGEVETLQRELRSSSTRLRQLERDLQDQRAAYDAVVRQQDHVPAGAADTQVKSAKIQQLERTLHDLRSNVNRLQSSLDDRIDALSAAEDRVASMKRERQMTTNELVAFERDLRTQQKENAEFGMELSRLKDEQVGSVSRHKVELDTLRRDLRSAREAYSRSERHLDEVKRDHATLQAWKSHHNCQAGLEVAMQGQKLRFKAQSKELAAQVKYLKAKFTREATFRNALTIQKRYLLLLVGGYSLNEQAILKQIASMGYPTPLPPRPRRTLKAVVIAVLGTIRARNAAGQWRRERRLKNEAVASYNDRKGDGL